ncbi:hypothetical protein [Staphylococcus gallinarum]|uniref:hypothetical protein n=1 Tax=Staphylococcus gallinarum TaxID=1293 RepID=UPI00317DD7F5
MGYEKVKSLSIDIKKLKFKATLASSNITPLIYKRVERSGVLDRWGNKPFLTEEEKFIIPIIKDIHGGMFKLEKSVSTKLRYAMLITSRYIDTLERETDFTFFDSYSDDKLQNNITWLSQIVNIFKQSYSKVDYKVNAYIQIDDECYLNRINKNSVSCVYLKSFAKNYSSWKKAKLDCEILKNNGHNAECIFD